MNQFTERYKTLTNPDLLKIIDNPGDYQPLAVETAKIELADRQLTEEEFADANFEDDAYKKEKLEKADKRRSFEYKMENVSATIIETLNPIQKTEVTPNKIINWISIAFCIIFVWQAVTNFGMLEFTLTDKNAARSFSMLFYFLPLLILPIATALFWQRKKYGWLLLFVFILYSGLTAAGVFILEFRLTQIDATPLDDFLPKSGLSYLGTVVFYSGCLWAISKPAIRELYGIDKRKMLKAAIVALVLVLGYYISSKI